MTIPDFFQKLRDPKETVKTAIVTVALATLSIVGTQCATGAINIVRARLEFPMEFAEMESLRKDLTKAPCNAIPMLASSAAEQNRLLEHHKEDNRHWYSDWMISDHWNAVPRLEMPCRHEPIQETGILP